MEQLIENLVAGLCAAGFEAKRAGPGGVIPRIGKAIVAVSVPEVSFLKNTENKINAMARIKATVFSPTADGAAGGQDTAYAVAQAIAAGISGFPPVPCKVAETVYNGRGDFFTTQVQGTLGIHCDEAGGFQTDGELTLTVNNQSIKSLRLIRMTRKQELLPVYAFGESAIIGKYVRSVVYTLTVEYCAPKGQWNAGQIMEYRDFTLKLARDGGVYVYGSCNWTECAWEDTEEGSVFRGTATAYYCVKQEGLS